MIGCSCPALRDWIAAKKLHVIEVDGVVRVDPRDVDHFSRVVARNRARFRGAVKPKRAKRPPVGEIYARVFALLEKGATRREIVMTCGITAEEAQHIWEQWRQESFEDAAVTARKREASEQERQYDEQMRRETQERLERMRGMLTKLKRKGDR